MTTTQTDDWWDRLYAEAETVAAEPAPPPRAAAGHVRGRLPDWWAEKPVDLTAADPDVEDLADDAGEDVDADDAKDQDRSDTEPEADDDPESPTNSGWFVPQAGYWPTPAMPALPAKAALSDGTKRLLYNITAAGTGYWLGPTQTIGSWIESCGRETSIGGALVLGGGICLAIAMWDRRTRHWQPGLLAWIARIPLASALTALALYAPASQI